jgi:D-alanine-D-alanine ligase
VKKAIILINKISEVPTPDEIDVLAQAEAIEKALSVLDISSVRVFFDLNLEQVKKQLLDLSADVVFNLVETVDNKGNLIHLSPILLESLGVPFSGSGSFPMFITSNKVKAKELFHSKNIPTAQWFTKTSISRPSSSKVYIYKPIWEDGSVGITDKSIVRGDDSLVTDFFLGKLSSEYFLEEFVDGREFNISVLGGPNEPEVMPAAEIVYIDYPQDKPRILNYASKWDESSFEYHNTVRTFNCSSKDNKIIERLKEISLSCWKELELKGYARVDFRVDSSGNPFVLEVNVNPCLSPDAGFIAACREAGIDYPSVIERIIYDAFH